MPLYDFLCDCGHAVTDRCLRVSEIEDHVELCVACGDKMEQQFKGSYKHHPWVPYIDHNIAHHPVLVESHAHRKRLLKANNADFASAGMGNPGCEV